jgi:serine/threonine protein kinase
MAILTGKRLGPYEIFSAIGAGGMGEVYRVRDTHLDRTAAIKIFPDHLADRAELRERFDCCRIGRRSWREPYAGTTPHVLYEGSTQRRQLIDLSSKSVRGLPLQFYHHGPPVGCSNIFHTMRHRFRPYRLPRSDVIHFRFTIR